MDARHAVTILINAGVIKESVIRDVSIYNDFLIMYKNPLNGTMSIYHNLSVKYDISVALIRKIVKKHSKKK
jgi:Mor family transcriptional regulator